MADDLELEEKKSPKMMIIIIAAVVLLLGGGAAAYFLMGGEEEPPAAEQSDAAKGEKKASKDKDDDEDEDEDAEKKPALYYNMKDLFVVNLPPGQDHKLLQAAIQVMSRDQAMVDFMTTNEPMLRHHIINLLSSQDAKVLKSRAGKEKLQADIVAKIKEVAEGMDVDGKVGNVYFTKLVME